MRATETSPEPANLIPLPTPHPAPVPTSASSEVATPFASSVSPPTPISAAISFPIAAVFSTPQGSADAEPSVRPAAARSAGSSRKGEREGPRPDVRHPRPGVRLTRRGRVVLVAIVAGLALTVLWLGTRAAVTASTSPVGPDRSGLPWVTVQDGDTLWEIAVAVGEDENPAELIRQIKNINGLSDSLIRPGTKLYLPSGHAG